MLTYKNTIAVAIILLVILLALDYVLPVSKWIYAGIILVSLFLMAFGSKNIQSGFYFRSLCSGNPEKNEIAITFDDGPDAQVTPMILDVLKKHKVKAAFFIVGNKASLHPEIIQRINKEGHIIGGHSFYHDFFFDLYSAGRMQQEMKQTEEAVFQLIAKRPKLFRPPYGVTNPPLAKAVARQEYISIGWSLKSNDTIIEDESAILEHLRSKVKSGDIILFHDNKPWNVKLLDQFLSEITTKDLKVARLDEFLNIQAYVY